MYAKTYLIKILFKNRWFKQIIFSKYGTNLNQSQRSLRNLGLQFTYVSIFNPFHFSFTAPLVFFKTRTLECFNIKNKIDLQI